MQQNSKFADNYDRNRRTKVSDGRGGLHQQNLALWQEWNRNVCVSNLCNWFRWFFNMFLNCILGIKLCSGSKVAQHSEVLQLHFISDPFCKTFLQLKKFEFWSGKNRFFSHKKCDFFSNQKPVVLSDPNKILFRIELNLPYIFEFQI